MEVIEAFVVLIPGASKVRMHFITVIQSVSEVNTLVVFLRIVEIKHVAVIR